MIPIKALVLRVRNNTRIYPNHVRIYLSRDVTHIRLDGIYQHQVFHNTIDFSTTTAITVPTSNYSRMCIGKLTTTRPCRPLQTIDTQFLTLALGKISPAERGITHRLVRGRGCFRANTHLRRIQHMGSTGAKLRTPRNRIMVSVLPKVGVRFSGLVVRPVRTWKITIKICNTRKMNHGT